MIGKLERDEGPLATGVFEPPRMLWPTSWSMTLLQEAHLCGNRCPIVLQALVDAGTLILFDGEYRLQTPESIEWETDYRGRLSRVLGDDVRMAAERETAMREALATALKRLNFLQGATKTPRKYEMHLRLRETHN